MLKGIRGRGADVVTNASFVRRFGLAIFADPAGSAKGCLIRVGVTASNGGLSKNPS
jgi:hypothetical protein